MDATYSSEMRAGVWAEVSPDECPCRGLGWMHDDFDAAWRCPLHGRDLGVGVPPHPEAYESYEEDYTFDHAQHLLLCRRDAYRKLRTNTGMAKHAFDRLVAAEALSPSPKDMLAAAVTVTRRIEDEAADADAVREGYACDLERRLEADAQRERWERSQR